VSSPAPRSAALALILTLCAALAACSGATAQVLPPRPTPPPAADESWATMSWEDRHDVMTFTVLPNLGRLFQHQRGTPYPDLTCASCHGADAEKVAYRMPNGLAALDPLHLPDPASADAKEARMAKFMIEEVTPKAAAMIGVEPGDPRTKQGFTCFNCHPSK
jgi:hypothetical protein